MLATLPFLAVVGLALPLLAVLSRRQLAASAGEPVELPSPRALAFQVLLLQAIVSGLAWLAAREASLSIDWRSRVTVGTVSTALVVVTTALLLASLEARRPLEARDRLRRQLRRGSPTDPIHLAATLAAALGEEYAYRGVLTALATPVAGLLPAAFASALLFGLAHSSQGTRGALLSGIFALVLQAIVVVTGGLALAIAVHLAYDLGAAWIGHRLRAAADAHPSE